MSLQIDEVIKKYQELKTLKEVAKFFNVSKEGIRKFFIKNNLPYTKSISYNHNENFFATDTEDSFYWAGFIAADGNITAKKDFTLSLKQGDYAHILKFKTIINSNAPITISPPKDLIICGIETRTSGSAIIRFRAKQWSEDFIRFNIVPNKTKIYSIPSNILNHKLVNHFIRGYFDGDGWFSHVKKLNRYLWGICGNLDVVENIKELLNDKCNISGKTTIVRQNNIFKLTYSKQHDVSNIVDYLYGNANVYLDRKYQLSKSAKLADEATIILNLDKSKLEESYQRLKSLALVSKEFNCCKSSIANYLKKYNIKLVS